MMKQTATKSKIPYLTLVAKDIYWLTRDLNYNEDILTMEQRCRIVTNLIPQINKASRLNPDCDNCGSEKSCKILNGLCSLTTMTDDGKCPYYLS